MTTLYHSEGLPVVFKHMALAIYRKNSGAEGKRFVDAFEAAKGCLIRNQHITAALQLTSAGRKLERLHAVEIGAARKAKDFDQLWAKYKHLVEEKESSKSVAVR